MINFTLYVAMMTVWWNHDRKKKKLRKAIREKDWVTVWEVM